MQSHLDSKFANGELARNTWAKDYDITDVISVQEFNENCGGVFRKCGNIILDNVLNKGGNPQRQTTIMVEPCEHMESSWEESNEKIYLIIIYFLDIIILRFIHQELSHEIKLKTFLSQFQEITIFLVITHYYLELCLNTMHY